jgi:hypothetical protein
MNFHSIGCSALALLVSVSISQAQGPALSPSRIKRAELSNVTRPPVEMQDAAYDGSRNFMPFYVLSHTTGPGSSAIPALEVKATAVVDAAKASVIMKKFGSYISGEFRMEGGDAIARDINYNTHKLYPFRLKSDGQLEELVSYSTTWKRSERRSSAANRQTGGFASSSVLQSGTWYKIGITQSGIHILNRNFFSAMGINTSKLDPASIRVYGNGGKMLPELNSAPRIDDLHENPIMVVDGGDGTFDNADYVLFYAAGPTEWKKAVTPPLKFQAVKNLYSDTSYYFVNVDLGPGKRIPVQPSGQTSGTTTSTYDYYNYHEQDVVNLAKSGRQMLGESFDFQNAYIFKWADGDFVTGDSIIGQFNVATNYVQSTVMQMSGNGLQLAVSTGVILGGEHPDYAVEASRTGGALNTNASEISLTLEKQTPRAAAWIDKITVNARRNLVLHGRQFQFRDRRTAAPGQAVQFQLTAASPQGVQLWNVTNPVEPFVQAYSVAGAGIQFIAGADSTNEYCIAPSVDFYTPTFISRVNNQNLHAVMQADYVIVAHPMFLKEAQRLGAFHQKMEGYTYYVATTDEVYNEFSSGRPDASAIRDFLRMIYSRNLTSGRQLRFACLMGDGSYNNKSRNLVNNSNLIPTYQSLNSFSPLESVASDDFYAMLDPHEGLKVTEASSTNLVDIGTGRFTCRTVAEVRGLLDKIEHYYSKEPNFRVEESVPISHSQSQSPLGDWRTWTLFVADDLDGAEHMGQADELANMVKNIAPAFNNDKIMLDAYQRFSTPGGNRYPDAADDFLRRIKKGAFLFNYTGHGGEVGLTGERLVDVEMINNFDNFNQLPLFITATCEFSRYDDPNRTSAGELSLLNPKGGAIALMTTCRLAFSSTNFSLNKLLITNIFTRLPNGSYPALGDILQKTKSGLKYQDFYFANFHLLGDPALRLAYPEYVVKTTRINQAAVDSASSDTLKALAKVTVEGIITDLAGNKLDFNGVVWPTVFDKEQTVQGLLNDVESAVDDDPVTPFTFKTQKNILYRGKTLAQKGDFRFTFLVPKDISYSPGKGKISYYATTGNHDAGGYYTNILVGGEAGNAVADNSGPEVDLFINDKNFVSGGITDENPILYADLVDSSGINTSGIGLGHDISVVLDERSDKPVILNDYYEANLNSYQSGRVRYPFSRLETGRHTLTFKVWDIQNNSKVVALDFIVAEKAELALKQVLNYPNPFTSRTKFFFEHNQSGSPLKVHIQVYTVSGRMVKTIQQTVVSESFLSEGIEWDGKDDYGDKLARGVYIYKLAILDINNKKAEKIEKLVILN